MHLNTEETNTIFTIEELAEYLKVAKSTLYKVAQEGKVPGQKVGKHWRFRKGAIDEWLRNGVAQDRFNGGKIIGSA